jgi:integrase
MMQSNQANTRVPADKEGNAEQQTAARRNRENVQEVSKHKKTALKSKWPKSDARHWQGRVFRNSYTRDGERHETADWCVKLGHEGRRETFNLATPNAEAAALRALKIYRVVIGAGWDAALAEFKPEAKAPEPSAPSTVCATIGQVIEAATRLSSARRESLDTYAKALRRIATGVLGMKGGKSGPKQGTDAWRDMIDATPLDKLTPAAVLAWKNAFLKSAANPQERNSAAVTVNSLLRNSKALLSKRVRPFLEKEIVLPSPLWFESVPMEKEPSMRYHSTIDAGTILRAAMEELAPEQPEAFKALILTLICGLRRSEADSMQWAQVDLNAGTLEMMDTEHRALKSADSAGKIALDAEVVALLRGFKAKTKSPFILETPKLARSAFKEHKSRTYRCDATHTTLIEWLRKNGVDGKRPIHTLRKEIGSIIATREGIFAASRYLRHSDIRITSRLYADTKTLVSAGLGALLSPAPKSVIEGNFTGQPEGAAKPKPKAKPALQSHQRT